MEDNTLCGAVVMNNTGMEGYIPAHILVYVAVNAAMRGRGIGANIIQAAIKHAGGDVALHVEYDNPAKRLYERLGFGSKYAEMRYIKDA
jgi:GNAT superfamily N-acetyltransferase